MASEEIHPRVVDAVEFFDMLEEMIPKKTDKEKRLAQEFWYIMREHANKKMSEIEETRKKPKKSKKARTRANREK